MVLENAFPPIPSELIMPLSGFKAQQGELTMFGVITAGTLGSMLGTCIWYLIGRKLGERRLRHWVSRYGKWITLSQSDIDRSHEWFRQRGGMAVFLGRLVPGVRSVISLPAGFAGMPLPGFLFYTALGTLIWTGLLAWTGRFLGANYQMVEGYLSPLSWAVIALILGAYVWKVVVCWHSCQEEPSAEKLAGSS